jgi:MFS family permease
MSVFTTLATPLSGALSDRARTRWGRRAPFIFLGSLIAALLTVGLSFMTTFWSITVLWVMASFCYNVAQVPMTTLIADRFAPVDRGKASGLLSAGQNIGASIGVVLAGLFVAQIQLGYIVYGAAVFSCCMAFILVNREPSAVDRAVEPFRLKSFVTGFWVSPREHPDFAWAFVSRFCMYMGYTLITTYMLYILQDYIGLSKDAANREIGIIFSIQLVGLLSMSIAGGMLSDWMKMRKPFVIAATILISIAYAVPVFEPTVFGLYVYAAIVGVGYGTFTSVDMALMTEVLPKTDDSAGKNLGLLIIALNIPLILGPILAAGILNATGNNYAALFITAATLICVSACMVVPIKSVR